MTGADPGRVLYVSYDGLLEPLGASQVLPYVVGAREAGVAISVLSFEKGADLDDVGAVEALGARLEGRGIPWIRRRWHGRPTLPATAWDVWRGRRVVRRWARSGEGPRVVHARSYLAGLMGEAGRRVGARLLFDMRGFWVDERIEGGYWRPGSLPVRVGRAVERRVLAAADHLVLLTRRGAGRVGDLFPPAAALPATVIPTCVDTDRFRPPEDPGAARAELGLGDGPILVHTGTLTGWYDGPGTLEVARAFVEETGGRFVVLTRDVAQARSLAAEARVEAVVRTVPPAEVPTWLQAADAGLALVRPSPAKDASYPTKVGEYLAVGLAVLATPVGDMDALADGVVVGILGGPDPVARTPVEAARWLAGAAARADRVERARARAREELSLEAGMARLLEVYRRLGIRPGGAP